MSNVQDDTAQPKSKKKPSQLFKLVLEIGPLAIYYLVNSFADDIIGATEKEAFFYATATFMVAIALSLSTSYTLFRTLPIIPVVSGFIIFIFGGLTLYFQDEIYIKLKPTVANLCFSAALLGGYAAGKPLMKIVFDGAFNLSDEGWRILSLRWGIFFLFLALLNEYVWRNYTNTQWLDFKVLGMLPLTVLFTMAQFPVIAKHALEDEPSDPAD